jgi:uncharacterized membrane protein YhaH (DUF805 family)
VSSNAYGQGPQGPGNYEDYSQGYASAPPAPYGQQQPAPQSQPSAPSYHQTNYEQPTYGQSTPDPYGQPIYGQQPTYGQPYTQQYLQEPGYDQAPGYGQQYGQGLAPYTTAYDSSPRPSVTMTQAVKLWLKNWKNFSGRASRSEYWWTALALGILWTIMGVIFAIVLVVTAAASNGSDAVISAALLIMMAVMAVVGLAQLVPSLSLGIRRLHDTSQSGWLCLINFVPYVGGIISIVLAAQPSNPAGARFDDAAQPLYGPETL